MTDSTNHTPWRTLARRPVLDRGKWLKVEEHTVQLPDGAVIPDWAWVVTPDFANVVAVTPAGDFVCFRQTKYGVAGVTLAPVGGYLEPGEAPLVAAQRELLEETGYASDHWTHLGSYTVDGNRGCGVAHYFLAQHAQPVAARHADDLEAQELVLLSRAEVEAALRAGDFRVATWSGVLALALLHL